MRLGDHSCYEASSWAADTDVHAGSTEYVGVLGRWECTTYCGVKGAGGTTLFLGPPEQCYCKYATVSDGRYQKKTGCC